MRVVYSTLNVSRSEGKTSWTERCAMGEFDEQISGHTRKEAQGTAANALLESGHLNHLRPQ